MRRRPPAPSLSTDDQDRGSELRGDAGDAADAHGHPGRHAAQLARDPTRKTRPRRPQRRAAHERARGYDSVMDNEKRLREAEEMTSADLIRTWERQAQTYSPNLNRCVDFVIVDIKDVGRHVGWLPRGKESDILSRLQMSRPIDPNFRPPAGQAATLASLWETRESASAQAAVWIAATMRPLAKDVRDKWRGQAGAFMVAESLVRKTGCTYHHSVSDTLPIELPRFFLETPPTYVGDFVTLAVFQAALVLANYTPGIICDLDEEQRSLERQRRSQP